MVSCHNNNFLEELKMKKGMGFLVCATLLSTTVLATSTAFAEEITSATTYDSTEISTYVEQKASSTEVTAESQISETAQSAVINGKQSNSRTTS